MTQSGHPPLNSRWSAVELKTKEAARNTPRSLSSDRAIALRIFLPQIRQPNIGTVSFN
jgi:hypothetical protein